ncbi:TPA: acyl carrier protein [Pseudomonas aeruginosa]
MDDIETRVRKLVAARFGVEECDIRLDSDFRNDFGAESLEVVELVMALEAEFGVEIADDDAERIRIETVRQAIDYLEEAVPT